MKIGARSEFKDDAMNFLMSTDGEQLLRFVYEGTSRNRQENRECSSFVYNSLAGNMELYEILFSDLDASRDSGYHTHDVDFDESWI